MNVLDELVIALGFKTDTKGLSDAEKAGKKAADNIRKDFADAAKQVAKSFTAMAAGVSAVQAGIFKLVDETADYANEVDKVSKAIGLQADEFQRLRFIQGQTGKSVQSLQMGFKTFLPALNDAVKKGTGPVAEGLAQLGIKAEDLAAQNGRGKMQLLAEGFKNIQNPAEKSAVAMRLFGAEAGGDLLGFLELGADGIDKMAKRADELGVVMGENAVKAGVGFKDSLDEMKQTLGGLVRLVGSEMLPIVKESIEDFRDWASANRGLIQQRIREFIYGLIRAIDMLAPILKSAVEFAAGLADNLGGVGIAILALTPTIFRLAGSLASVATQVSSLITKFPMLSGVAGAAIAGLTIGKALDDWFDISGYVANTLLSMQGIAQISGSEYGTRVNRSRISQTERWQLEALDRQVADAEKAGDVDKLAKIRRKRQLTEKALYMKLQRQGAQPSAESSGSSKASNKFSGMVGAPGSLGAAGGKSKGSGISRGTRKQFEERLRKIAEGTGLGDVAINKGLMAIQSQISGGAVENVAFEAGLSTLSSLSGQDLAARAAQQNATLSGLLGPGQPDLPLSEITKGAQPQVLTSIINNNFSFDNEFNINGSGDPGAVGESIVESFRTYFQETVEATSRSVKVNFAR